MPVRFRCSNCKRVLYTFTPGQNYRGLPTLSELVELIGGNRCPYCGKPLEKPSVERVVIR